LLHRLLRHAIWIRMTTFEDLEVILLLSLQDGISFLSYSPSHFFWTHHFGQQIVSFVMKVSGTGIATSRLDGLASSLCLLG